MGPASRRQPSPSFTSIIRHSWSSAIPISLPETSKGYDVGFEQPLLHDRLRFGVTYFHNDITNLNEGTTNPTTFVSTYVNVGQATTQGVETFAAFALTNRVNFCAPTTPTPRQETI